VQDKSVTFKIKPNNVVIIIILELSIMVAMYGREMDKEWQRQRIEVGDTRTLDTCTIRHT
jgi:hypothetical protein